MQGAAWIRKQNGSRLGAFLMAKGKEAAEKSRCEAWAIWARLLRDDEVMPEVEDDRDWSLI